jgi:hypothetical protein
MKNSIPKIRAGTYGHGSYGYASDPPGTTMTLWHCGVYVVNGRLFDKSSGYFGNTTTACMHWTRELARDCPNRRRYIQVGKMSKAVNMRGTIAVPSAVVPL